LDLSGKDILPDVTTKGEWHMSVGLFFHYWAWTEQSEPLLLRSARWSHERLWHFVARLNDFWLALVGLDFHRKSRVHAPPAASTKSLKPKRSEDRTVCTSDREIVSGNPSRSPKKFLFLPPLWCIGIAKLFVVRPLHGFLTGPTNPIPCPVPRW